MGQKVDWEERAKNAVTTDDWSEIFLFSDDFSELEARSLNALANLISNYKEAWYVAWHIYCIFRMSEKEWAMDPDTYCTEINKARTVAISKMLEYAKFKYQLKDIVRFADFSFNYYIDQPFPDFAEQARQRLANFKSK